MIRNAAHARNVILLTVDCLRADAIGRSVGNVSITPALDRLGQTGTRFTQAITAGSWTQAAFPALLTSSFAAHHGGCLTKLNSQRPSPVEALSQYGYATAGFSTNPHVSESTGYGRGFETFIDLAPNEEDPSLRKMKGGHFLLRRPSFHRVCSMAGLRMAPARPYSSAAELTTQVLRCLGKIRRPYFLWAHFMDAHWPYKIANARTKPDEIASIWQDLSRFHRLARDSSPPAAETEKLFNLYLKKVRDIDREVDRIQAHLESTGEADQTVICVTSDHGEEFWEHGRWGHWESNLYDEIIRVPLLFAIPGREGPKQVDRQVTTLDIMPTLLALVQCPPPPGMKGANLAPLWDNVAADCFTDLAFCEMPRPSWHRIAARTERFKYIWDSRTPESGELYDLIADPNESFEVRDRFPLELEQLHKKVQLHLQVGLDTNVAGDALLPDEIVRKRLRALGYL